MSAIPDFSKVDLASSSNKRETREDWAAAAAKAAGGSSETLDWQTPEGSAVKPL